MVKMTGWWTTWAAAVLLLFSCGASEQEFEAMADEVVPPASAEPAVHVILRYRTQPGMGDAFAAALAPLMVEVRKEPHFLGITILRDMADPDRFTFVERWADKDYYLGAHAATSHLASFKQQAMPLLAGPPDIGLWSRVEEVSAP